MPAPDDAPATWANATPPCDVSRHHNKRQDPRSTNPRDKPGTVDPRLKLHHTSLRSLTDESTPQTMQRHKLEMPARCRAPPAGQGALWPALSDNLAPPVRKTNCASPDPPNLAAASMACRACRAARSNCTGTPHVIHETGPALGRQPREPIRKMGRNPGPDSGPKTRTAPNNTHCECCSARCTFLGRLPGPDLGPTTRCRNTPSGHEIYTPGFAAGLPSVTALLLEAGTRQGGA